MKAIVPSEISTEIIKLINTAEKYLILVSPYNNWNQWHEFKRSLKNSLNKKIIVCLYLKSKEFEYKKFKYWDKLGLRIYVIDNLHAKLYLSENTVLLASLNLLFYSVTNSLEIGIINSSKEEQEYWKQYFDDYIKFKGSRFLSYHEAKNDTDFNQCWFCSIPTIDMYFDW